MDFESTAIPGYAISAASWRRRGCHKDDGRRSDMRITFLSEGEEIVVEGEGRMSIADALAKTPIHPSTVLAVFEGTVVPQNTIIKDDVRLELIIVSSGG